MGLERAQTEDYTNLTLSSNFNGQGQQRVIIYIQFVYIESLMLHSEFKDHQTSGSGEDDFLRFSPLYWHGGYLGHVTKTIFMKLRFPFPRRLHIILGFDWPSGFREEDR